MPLKEESAFMKLHTPHQVTKMLRELYTNYYHNLYGLPIVNARLTQEKSKSPHFKGK